MKKIQKKARQEGNKSSSETESQCDSMETESNIKIKDETHSKRWKILFNTLDCSQITVILLFSILLFHLYASFDLYLGDNDSYGSGLLDMNHSNIKSNIKDSDEHEEECFKRALNLCSSFHNYKGKDASFTNGK